jgi:hypothetical protein
MEVRDMSKIMEYKNATLKGLKVIELSSCRQDYPKEECIKWCDVVKGVAIRKGNFSEDMLDSLIDWLERVKCTIVDS